MMKILLVSLVNIALFISCSSLGINLNNEEGRANKLKEELSKSIVGEKPDIEKIVDIAFKIENCKEIEPVWDAFFEGDLGFEDQGGLIRIAEFIDVINTSFIGDVENPYKLICTYNVRSNIGDNPIEMSFEISRTNRSATFDISKETRERLNISYE